MRRLVGGGVALLCVLTSVVTGVATPAHAQQDLVESDPQVIQARAELEAAQAAAHQVADELTATTQKRDATQAAIDDHVAHITQLDQQRAQLAAERDALQVTLRDRAVALYRAGGDTSGLDSLATEDVVAAARRQTLGNLAAQATRRTQRKLDEARDALGKIQDTLRQEEADLQQQKAQLDDLVTKEQVLQADMNQKVAVADAALARARAIGALRASRYPVMGPSLLTADQLVAWYNAQGYSPHLETSISDLAQTFIQEGNDEGVRGDFAFAQSIIETAGFSSAPANNYAGIGWCDSCSDGNHFPTPRDGVRAQIQLLLNYADSDSRAANLHHPVSPYLYGGDPVAAAQKFDSFFAKGWAPTWEDMGHGNWATAPNYAEAVIGVYNRMTRFGQAG
ncbi:MAG TPA: glucosaminidase domain-containing protein [Acidimicrobiia bacterium]|nr:glucosaminidase domain-containing protein [Acidimicrobiia bacterium]